MSIESILEHAQNTGVITAATLTTTVGSPIVSGTGLDAYSVDDLIWWTDDNGVFQQNQVKVATSAIAMTLYRDVNSVSSGVVPRIVEAANNKEYWFRANNSVLKSLILRPTTDNRKIMLLTAPPGGSGKTLISRNEGVLLKTLYIRFPYQYTMSNSPISVSLWYVRDDGVVIRRIAQVGEDSEIFIPRENGEIEINAFIPTPWLGLEDTSFTDWQISAVIEETNGDNLDDDDPGITTDKPPSVSQVNGPSSLNDQQLRVVVGARILHASAPLHA